MKIFYKSMKCCYYFSFVDKVDKINVLDVLKLLCLILFNGELNL